VDKSTEEMPGGLELCPALHSMARHERGGLSAAFQIQL
jgi:hypothetical protein